MGRPVFFVENLLSRRTFPDHVLTASSTETGLDVAFVATGRRQRSLNRWAPSGYHAAAYIQCTFDRVRAFDHVAIDRGHNLGGYTVQVLVSSDGFTTYTTAGSAVIPTQVFPYSRLSDNLPILTEEGAVLWRMDQYAGSAVRLNVPDMGVGLKPEIVGAYIGMAFRPEHAPQKPFSHGKVRLLYDVERSPQAWAAAGEIGKLRAGTVELWLADRAEYALARYHIEGLYFARKPMWLVMDDEEAEKARLVVCPPGDAGFEVSSGWSEYRGTIPYEEHEPALIGGGVT
jgi:hypothetical protein